MKRKGVVKWRKAGILLSFGMTLVPVWRLSEVLTKTSEGVYPMIRLANPVRINAIDGSVIDFYDEV